MARAIYSSRDQRLSLIAAVFCTSVVGTTTGLTWPLLSLILSREGVADSLIGLSSAIQSAAALAISPVAPRLVARLGMIRTIAGCIATVAIALLLLPIYRDLNAWFLIRFALGAAVAVLFIATQTWVSQLTPNHARGRVIGVFGFLWSAGFASGPLIIRLTGIEGWAPFAAAIALVLAAGLPLFLATEPVAAGPDSGLEPDVARPGLWIPAVLSALALGCLDSINDSFLPLYSLRNGMAQGSAVTLLFILQLGTLAIQLPIGWAADRFNPSRLLTALAALALLMGLLLPYAIVIPPLLWPSVFILGMALGGIWTVSLVLVGQLYRYAELTRVNARKSLLNGLGSVLGPVVAGVVFELTDRWSLPAVLTFICALFFVHCITAAGRRSNRM